MRWEGGSHVRRAEHEAYVRWPAGPTISRCCWEQLVARRYWFWSIGVDNEADCRRAGTQGLGGDAIEEMFPRRDGVAESATMGLETELGEVGRQVLRKPLGAEGGQGCLEG